MTEKPDTIADKGSLRYKIGVWMFILGNVLTFSSAIVIPAIGLPIAWIGAAVLLGEGLAVCSIPIIGMQGFMELKNKMFSIFKRKPVDELKPVGRFRHVTGLILVCSSTVLFPWAATMFMITGFKTVSEENPFPTVWGIPFEQQLETFVTLMVLGEVGTLAGLILLGGLWWERVRQLFVRADKL